MYDNKSVLLPLSHPQIRMVIKEQRKPGTSLLNIAIMVRFKETFDFNILQNAINMYIRENDILRTRIIFDEGTFKQYTAEYKEETFEMLDFSGQENRIEANEHKLNKWVEEFASKPIFAADSPLCKFVTLKLPDHKPGYMLNIHHSINDGTSIVVMLNRIAEICKALSSGKDIPEQQTASYLDFIVYEQEYIKSEQFKIDRDFWLKEYETLPETAPLRPYTKEPGVVSYQIKKILDKDRTEKIYKASNDTKISVYRLFLAALFIYQGRVSGKDDISIGFAVSNRPKEWDNSAGMFVNYIPFRLRQIEDTNFKDLSEAINKKMHEYVQHGRHSFDLIVEEIRRERGEYRDVLEISFAQYLEKFYSHDVSTEFIDIGSSDTPISIFCASDERGGSMPIEFFIRYNANIFTAHEAEEMLEIITEIVLDGIENPQKMFSEFSIISEADKMKVLKEFNNTQLEYPKGLTYQEIFEEQVAKTPDHTALVYKDEKLSYSEFNARINQLARRLREMGIKPDMPVGILIERSTEIVISMMAVLKAGGCFIPIDSEYPQDRMEYMLENSEATVLITQAHFADRLNYSGTIINLSNEDVFVGDSSNLPIINKSGDLAYIIYTSGSTGKPKGVMIENHSLVNLCIWSKETFQLSSDDNFAKHGGFSFDASIIEIFPAFLAGAALFVIPDDIRLSILQLNEYYEANNITYMVCTTQFGEQFIEMTNNKSLRNLVLGGEKMRTYREMNGNLFNGYGPTESTVIATSKLVDRQYDNIPIGKPVGNTRAYILDKYNNLMPIGVPGELCLSGVGLARGYINLPDKTAAAFVENPFEPGEKMYRTGDLVRWLSNGDIEYWGRIDRQVKVRGYRIELGEIETVFKSVPEISDAVVVDRKDTKGVYLAGYYVAEKEFEPAELKEMLSKDLPDYMIPQYIMKIDKVPLTPNGKVDHRALPEILTKPVEKKEFTAPETDTEIKLAELWKEVLNLENISALDDFFSIGGHSLKAVMLMAKIDKTFSVTLLLKDIFRYTVLRDMAQFIEKQDTKESVTMEPAPKAEYYPLSSAQRQLFVLDQMNGIGITYNVPVMLKIKGELDASRLSDSLLKIITLHETLRTSFDIADGSPVQRIHPDVKLKKVFTEASEEQIDSMAEDFCRPFNLEKTPLVRIQLVKTAPQTHYLFLDFHHIVFDGISMGIMLKDLSRIYAGEELTAPEIQYKDFVVWQNNLLKSGALDKQKEFWLKYLDDVPLLDMPTDFPRKPKIDFDGDFAETDVSREINFMIENLMRESGATKNIVLLTALFVLLRSYTKQEDIIVGSPTGGRAHEELSRSLGMFVNTLPIRAFPEQGKPVRKLLEEVKHSVLDVYSNEDYPIEELYDKLSSKREAGRNPLFDMILVFQNMDSETFAADGIESELLPIETDTAKFDITFELSEINDIIKLKTIFRKSLYTKDTIQRINRHFISILDIMSQNPDIAVGEIDYLSSQEKHDLLYEYNQTDADWPRDKTAHQLFEEMVAKYPDNVAIELGEDNLTYSQLNAKANQLARLLRGKGVGRESIVGIFMERSIEMVLSALAIMKAGGTYLPIIPDYPPERIDFMLSDSGTKILLTSKMLGESLKYDGDKIDVFDQSLYTGDAANLDNIADPNSMIYIIYTSGSTGKPKGVMLEHHNLVRLMKNSKFQFDFGPGDVWTLFHSFSFDFSVWEMYGPLLFGGKLLIVTKEIAQNPDDFIDLLADRKVTVLNQTPGAFYNLIAEEEKRDDKKLGLRYVIFGGEALKPIMLRHFHERYPETKLINMYGITETTVHVTFKEITQYEIDNNISNIGLPIPTLKLYVMDDGKKLMPTGVAGELCVSGEGVARGYLNREELTNQKFIPNPFNPSERMYRSGDLARRMANGEMEYLGRIDFQVKIRGFRIELGEIEDKLLKHNDIQKVVVLAREDKNKEKYLCAYYVANSELMVKDLRKFLSKDLPDYMIPSYFIWQEEFILTSNGKVDRAKLPEPGEHISTGVEYVAPRNEKEEKIAEIWKEVLELDAVGVNDDFFALGGHSLKAVSLTARLQQYFDVRVNEIFEHPTVAELAKNIKECDDYLKSKLEQLKNYKEPDFDPDKDEQVLKAKEDYKKQIAEYNSRDFSEQNNYDSYLITGATGYLGVYILRDLLMSDAKSVNTVVRAADNDAAKERIHKKLQFYFADEYGQFNLDKLTVLAGDLSEDNMGLSDDVFNQLTSSVQCVIHSAANVKHYGHYDEFYKANVKATENVLEFALKCNNAAFHQISTYSVAMGDILGKKAIFFSENCLNESQQPDNYYVKTKLESEELTVQYREKGLNTSIFRVGNIVFNSQTGLHQENLDDNGFYNIVKSYINLGAVLENDLYDFSFVDYVAGSVLTLSNNKALSNEIYHIENPNLVNITQMLQESSLGVNIDSYDRKGFINFLYKNFERPGFRELIEKFMLHKGWLTKDSELEAQTIYVRSSEKTNALLQKCGFEWPKADTESLKHMIISALQERIGFLKEQELFKSLSEELLTEFAAIAKDKYYDMDEDIVWENETADEFYLVREGNIEQMRHSSQGWLGTIDVLGEGDVFGEGALWGESSATISQAILDEVRVLAVDKAKALVLLSKNPELSLNMLKAVSKRSENLKKLIVAMG